MKRKYVAKENDQPMQIFIPTKGRLRQKTLEWLPDRWLEQTWLVVTKDEDGMHDHPNVLIRPDILGVPAARQYAMLHAHTDNVFFFDDDLTFDHRRLDRPTNFVKASKKQVGAGLDTMELLLQSGFAGVSINTRGQANTHAQKQYLSCARMMRAFGIRRDVLLHHKIRFDKFLYWEDFHVQLSLLKEGYETRNLVSLIHGTGQGNADGGVSTYRTVSSLMDVQREFLEFHRPFCKAELKTTTWKWLGDAKVPDFTCYWKKAFMEGMKKWQ